MTSFCFPHDCRARTVRLILPMLLAGAVSTYAQTDLGNIMPLGDSITYGVGAPGGYRDPLYSDLTAAGDTFTFVGSMAGNATPKLTAAGETGDEGNPGYVIQAQDPTDPTPSGEGGIVNIIGDVLAGLPASQKPNLFLLMIGTNDMNIDYDVADAPARLENLINLLVNPTSGLDPGATVILAQLTPGSEAAVNSRIVTFNDAMPGIVQALNAQGEKVSLVDMYNALDSSTDLSDTLHPNQAGYDKMATVWAAGIKATVAPEPSSLGMIVLGVFALGLLGRRARHALHG